jgi:hypothetical protein
MDGGGIDGGGIDAGADFGAPEIGPERPGDGGGPDLAPDGGAHPDSVVAIDAVAGEGGRDASSASDASNPDSSPEDWIPKVDATDLPGAGACANASVERVSLLPVHGAGGASAMVASDAELFVSAFDGMTGRSAVWAVPILGGAPRLVLDEADEIYALALVGDALLYSTGSNIKRVATRGGTSTLISTAKSGGRSLTVVGESLYWAADGVVSPWDGGVFLAPLNGGPSTTLASGVRAKGVYLVAGALYAIAGDTPRDPSGALLRIPVPGGAADRVGSANFAGVRAMAGVDSRAFVLSDRVYEVDLNTGAATPLYSERSDTGAHSITAAGRQLYWTYEGYWGGTGSVSGGHVRRFDLDAGQLTEIAVCLPKPGPLAVDQRWVYWLNWLSGEILRAPR